MYDFIIVGAGIAGLELGAMLAQDGYRVLVLEQAQHVGGRAFIHEKDGFILDNGIHLVRFGKKSAIAKVINRIGGNIEFKRLGKSYFVDQNNNFVLFPTSPSDFFKSEMFTIAERLKALFAMLQIKMNKYKDTENLTVSDWMVNEHIQKGLKRYFSLVSGSMLVCPDIAVASLSALTENISKVLKTGISVEYPLHGWAKDIIEPITNKIKQSGEIRVNSKVRSVIIENGRATGVRLSNDNIKANNIIIDVPSQYIDEILDTDLIHDNSLKNASNLVPTAGISIDYALDGIISDIDGLIYLEDPLSFGCFVSSLSSNVAPKDKSLLTWFCPIVHEKMKNDAVVKGYQDSLEKKIESVFPEIKRRTIFKRVLHFDMVDGVELNINQLRQKRINFALNGVENLYFVGDTTSARGAGGDVAHESSIECYEEITGKTVK